MNPYDARIAELEYKCKNGLRNNPFGLLEERELKELRMKAEGYGAALREMLAIVANKLWKKDGL